MTSVGRMSSPRRVNDKEAEMVVAYTDLLLPATSATTSLSCRQRRRASATYCYQAPLCPAAAGGSRARYGRRSGRGSTLPSCTTTRRWPACSTVPPRSMEERRQPSWKTSSWNEYNLLEVTSFHNGRGKKLLHAPIVRLFFLSKLNT